jgi:hypothetical protein
VIVKRVAAFLLASSLMHLNAVRADGACLSHEMEAPVAASAQQADDHHAHHDAAPTAPAPDDEPCDAPLAVDCCASVASCGIAFAGGERATSGICAEAHRLILPITLETPPGTDNAPEPPPPRA